MEKNSAMNRQVMQLSNTNWQFFFISKSQNKKIKLTNFPKNSTNFQILVHFLDAASGIDTFVSETKNPSKR